MKTICKLLLILFILSCAREGQTIITHNGNFVKRDVTLSKNISAPETFAGTIRITKSIAVEENIKVIFEPGTIIESDEDVVIEVRGHIIAQGTAEEPIIFKSSNDSVLWGGFDFVSDTEGEVSIFDHCIIKGSNVSFYNENDGRIKMTNTSVGGE